MDQVKHVALFGGTGLLGSAVVEALLARNDQFELTLFTRSSSTHEIQAKARVAAIESFHDISEGSTLVQCLRGHDVLVSTLNSAVAVECKDRAAPLQYIKSQLTSVVQWNPSWWQPPFKRVSSISCRPSIPWT